MLCLIESLKRQPKESTSPLYTIQLFIPEGVSYNYCPWYDILQYAADMQIMAELRIILHIIKLVCKRWTEIDEYLATLLVEDFMKPKQYYGLLFDDENFTRSRKYFWVIGCLNEFIISIGDNINQCADFYTGRLLPLLNDKNLADLLDASCVTKYPTNTSLASDLTNSDKVGKFKMYGEKLLGLQEKLLNQQNPFKNKLDTVKSLRDGVSQPCLPPHH